jgi:hypothetical protein
MSAEIIELKPKNPGNGAREAIIDIVEIMMYGENASDAAFRADWILVMLGRRGFVVVPIDEVAE